jgi:hypothetical protein
VVIPVVVGLIHASNRFMAGIREFLLLTGNMQEESLFSYKHFLVFVSELGTSGVKTRPISRKSLTKASQNHSFS